MSGETEPLYDVQEATGDPSHPSVDTVCDRAIDRAQTFPHDQDPVPPGRSLRQIIDRHGEDTVREAMRLILVERHTFRLAASVQGLENIEGATVGTAAVAALRELQQQ